MRHCLPPLPLPTMLADLHLHTDHDEERGNWHGMHPDQLVQHILPTALDLIAITEHNRVTQHYYTVRQRLADAIGDSKRQIQVLLGIELSVGFGGSRYHVGYIFEEQFDDGILPEVPELGVALSKLEEYRQYYPGVVILNHPTWKDGCPGDQSRTRDIMQSGLIDGVEILNGALILNGNGSGERMSREACEMFVAAKTNDTTLAPIGSSDAHKPYQVASAATAFVGNGPADLFSAIKRGTTTAVALESRVRAVSERIVLAVPKVADFFAPASLSSTK